MTTLIYPMAIDEVTEVTECNYTGKMIRLISDNVTMKNPHGSSKQEKYLISKICVLHTW